MTLILPVSEDGGGTEGVEDEEDPQQPVQKPAALERSVLALNVELNIALTSLTMPLGEVQSLGVGDVLELGVSAFDQANVLTRDGRKLSRGTLGQIDGVRALQLEHAAQSARVPRRRASDRAALDLPLVEGDGTGTGAAMGGLGDLADPPALALPDAPAGMDDLPALDALPDMPELPDLPDLPDMSDLPGFGDDVGLPKLETG
jgi:flagellar motor switch/type III secretory pathway protein FliN